nr:hypothetical protein [uncultured Kingella sp.]
MHRLPIAFLLLLTQTACTSVLWNGGIYDADRAIKTQRQITRTQNDTIHTISQIPRHASAQLSGSLILQGEQYWYALHPSISQDLAATLRAPLSQPYHITQPYSGSPQASLRIRITDQSHFVSNFCLDYTIQGSLKTSAANANNERSILTTLKFQPQANPNHYRKCIATTGSIYQTPPSNTISQTLPQPIPAELVFEEKKVSISRRKLTRNVLFTPLAFATDITSGMVIMSVLLIGSLF